MVPGGSVDVRRGTIFDRSAPGSRRPCHPGHKRSATVDTASSNSWPFWYRSSGRLESDLRTTSSSGGSSPGLSTDGGLGGACTCLAMSGEGPSAPDAVNGGSPTMGSENMIPAEYRSLRPATLLDAACSRGMDWGGATAVAV